MGVKIADEQFILLADKALYWPEQKILCIADAHFGKGAAYRALGQPVPHGTTAENIKRLDSLLAHHETRQIIFLGDFLHAPESHAMATLNALIKWRTQNKNLKCTLIRGNHDLRAGDPPENLAFDVVNEPYLIGAFAFCHTPQIQPDYHVFAGHVHPVFKINGKGRQRLKLPCFHHSAEITILPSFGEFTGGFVLPNAGRNKIFITDGKALWLVNNTL